jgi:putative endonuclease
MYFVYILYSTSIDKFYIGQTQDVNNRLREHVEYKNLGANDWIIKHTEQYNTRSEAMKRETEIKKKKRRSYIEWLISNKLR